MRVILHITDRGAWEFAKKSGSYSGDTLGTEGFIHFSRPHQILGVANRFFKGSDQLILLMVNEEKVKAEVKYEGSDGQIFPHVYGPLNLDAVVETYEFNEGPGGFRFPSELELVGDTLIRPGFSGDEAEIASCHTHAWQQSYRGLVPDSILDTRPLSFRSRFLWWKSVVNRRGQTVVFLAESAQHGIVGFCAIEPARDESMKGYGEISAIYCLREYKGKGIGAALLRAGLSHLKKMKFEIAYLWVLEGNPSIGFYRRMGGVPLEQGKTIDLGGPLKEIGFSFSL